MGTLNDTDQESMTTVLRALIALVEGRSIPFDCTPHGPGHEGIWVQRAKALISQATEYDFDDDTD